MPARLAAAPPRDPARAALAEAIKARDALRADCEALRAAELEAREAIRAARGVHQRAEGSLAEAKDAAASASLAKALGGHGNTVPPLATARRMLTDAEDALEVAQSAETQRANRLHATLQRLSSADDLVSQCARRVMAELPNVRNLVANVTRLQREMLDATLALEFLTQHSAVHVSPALPTEERDAIVQAGFRLRSPPKTWNGLLHFSMIDGAKPWEAAFRALCADADAVLP